MDDFSVRWEGSLQTQRAGEYQFRLRADDGMRMWIDGNLVVDDWNARPAVIKTAKVNLPADKRVPVRIEYFQGIRQAEIDLRWLPPGDDNTKVFTRKVYLPAGQWFDFWTGKTIDGGQTIDAPAPIERMPLFAKAGTILPMGPVVQYASEQPDAPLELRIYRGADGAFTLYDDAGEGYGYEKGEYATIPLAWDDKAGTLTIGAQTGNYPGMPAKRQFRVVFVGGEHGAGPDVAAPDEVVEFSGSAKVVRVQR